ncbi:MAG: glycosyltransferase [Acidimicrobiia bacterium]|nr:glycosyltransferase [Acidimicrobiia bacterium]
MSERTPTIVLTMIVKNEAHVIERCLTSVMPLVDAYCIVDTGSSDGTQDVIREVMAGVPGEVFDRPWHDFGTNRSEALELARPFGDYSLMIDADVQCVLEPGFDAAEFRRDLTADYYRIMFKDMLEYQRPLISTTRLPFTYRGVLHEYLEIPPGATDGGIVSGLHYRSSTDGASWKDPDKYAKDARTFATALAENRDPELRGRYTFYLAQSLRDSGAVDAAAAMYRERAEMAGWEEENYVSWLWHARLLRQLGRPLSEILDALMQAQEVRPQRAEAWCQAATYAREDRRFQTAFVFARRALDIPRPTDALFVEPDTYEWKALYEYSIAAYYAGDYVGGIRACHRLLFADRLPPAEREATERNLEFYPAEAIGEAR